MATALPPPARARLLAVVAPISLVGIAAYATATVWFAHATSSSAAVAGVAAFLALSVFVERFPVAVEGADANGVSLGFVFAVAALVLFGWAAATFVYASAPTLIALLERRPLIRTAYNAGVFGLAGSMAGAMLSMVHGSGPGAVVVRVGVTAVVLYVANVLLVTAAIAASGARPALGFVALARSNIRWTILPFTLMAPTALTLVVLWQRTPYFFVALAGPLAAIALYQRSTSKALSATRLALTDPLTGLGNHRHFHERLERALEAAAAHRSTLSLCLLDLDDFKQVNDRFGHPAGDRVLSEVAARLRSSGEGFRLGGDEFALLLPDVNEPLAVAAAQSIVARLEAAELGPADSITVSAGLATFPQHGRDRDTLIRLADTALYWAKEQGKNQVRLARREAGDVVAALGGNALGRRAPFRAAASLARAVDARHADRGSHSERVAVLAGRLAERLGLDEQHVELTKLAGSLHDLGKLGIPEGILRKAGSLSEEERASIERHPQIAYRMLASLGAEEVADWVLHQAERWDGRGYPEGRRGDAIPLGARIIFVADAFDAMTSPRPYRPALDRAEAMREVERCAGSQFDPDVVNALLETVEA
jgi:diguanylate cyclase (GGDEF)-like protein